MSMIFYNLGACFGIILAPETLLIKFDIEKGNANRFLSFKQIIIKLNTAVTVWNEHRKQESILVAFK